MAVKLTKSELKNQKDQLKQFQRYLPTLELKKQQLQLIEMQIEAEKNRVRRELDGAAGRLDSWIAVFSENASFPVEKQLDTLIRPEKIISGEENVAGVRVPVYKELKFEDETYDAADYPLWVDAAVEKLRDIARLDAQIKVLERRYELINNELRSTSQRVNLFEKVMIPNAKENIRVISIYLSDQMTAEVVRGKIAKKKLQEAAQ